MTRAVLMRLMVVGSSIILALLLAETTIRLLGVRTLSPPFIADEHVGFRRSAHVDSIARTDEYVARFATNEYGMRDASRIKNKPPHTYRVAVLGDSFVESVEVEIEQRFTNLVEQHLNNQSDVLLACGWQNIEVLNFGVAGFSTAQEWQYYLNYVRDFEPDLVLLTIFVENDVRDNSYVLDVEEYKSPAIRPYYVIGNDGSLELKNPSFYMEAQKYVRLHSPFDGITGFLSWLQRKSDVAALSAKPIYRLLSHQSSSGSPMVNQKTASSYDLEVQRTDQWQMAWKITRRIIEELAQAVQQDGADFHALVLPGPTAINIETRNNVLSHFDPSTYDLELPHRSMIELLDATGFSYTTVDTLVKNSDPHGEGLVYLPRNGHLTVKGHEIIASELERVMVERLLDQCNSSESSYVAAEEN